ncbi:MAG: PrgI family protein [Lachnospiraceae bacterium]|nr:PrgI family protein [Lachnospiraceae bacterium]
MTIAVDVLKDLSGIKTKVALNLTKRQLVCFGGAAVTGVPLYLLTKGTIGKMFGTVQYFDITASQVNDELLQRFLDIDENLTVSIHMQTMDPVKASKMLKNKLSNIQKMKIDEQKKAVRSGYDMDIMPSDIVTFENDALELINDLNSSNQKIIRMTFLIACFGRTKKEMENLLQRVSGIV